MSLLEKEEGKCEAFLGMPSDDRPPNGCEGAIPKERRKMKEFQLRTWKTEDAKSLVQAADNPNIAKYLRNTFPNPYKLEDAVWFINDCISNTEKKQINYAIEVDGQAVGGIGVFVKDDVYEKSAELGYWLSEDYWRNGIMSGAVRSICKEAFAAFDIVRIFAEPFADNAASRRVLEKAGFTYEGTMRNGVYKNGKVLSYCMYSVLREEIEL